MIFFPALGLMILASFSAMVLIDPDGTQDHGAIFLSGLLGLAFYSMVLVATGHFDRFLQTISAIIACSSILTLLFVAEYVLLRPCLGARIAGIIANLIIFWSVPVEGHIISRAIGQHWFVGIAIAIAAFVLQIGIQTMLTGQT
jgi:CBS domain containing-hemolysin-like protein